MEGAKLSGNDLRGFNLENAILSGTNLRGFNLENAILSGINLSGTNLEHADLENANLYSANLSRVTGLNTIFKGAILTGACIKDWNINSKTNFEGVICNYIYLKEGQQERRPCDPNRNFEPGEFAKLVEQSIETVDLIFLNGIDWQSFLTAFRELQTENESGELSVRAIEKKRDNAFVVRVDAPTGANKETIEESFWGKYKPLLEAKDREIKLLSQQTEFYSQQIELIRQDNTRLLGVVETMAEKETSKINMTFHAPVNAVAGNVEGNQNVYAPEQKQTLVEAADEIQKLLKQLEQTNPSKTTTEQMVVAAEAIKRIESDPNWKQRVINAAREGGLAAFEKALDNPAGAFITGAVQGWLEA